MPNKEVVIQLRVSKKEADNWRRHAKHHDMTVSALVRMAMNQEVLRG